ncbi:TonB-dependent receptor domain-containing protein [Novosphingobium pentaromativorans]|uniref:TonB-dependent receptor domain-containing protein n=1 Tax=Novosphingobium pentaromativorans TaxID=205844 RepID=UPI0009DB54AC|nr:TonB-dependent receptor [Novosphingobium pentaromativorans]
MDCAEQAGISIALNDPALDELPSSGLRGRFTARQAFSRLLQGSGYRFAFPDARTVLILKAPRPSRNRPRLPARVTPVPPPPSEIVVTATKQDRTLANYPSSISFVSMEPSDSARYGAQGSALILQHIPALSSTNLGPGRNKIFIRGIADSSFNGSNQSTISQYLGDARLIYSAPDPDLLLYDVAKVEVLEGPQGTLYGAGTLGGIIHIVPRIPDASSARFGISGGVHLTQNGKPGGDLAGVLNLPLERDRLALRLVAYSSQEGGYIDDAQRRQRDVNRNTVTGIRASLRWTPSADWTVDLSMVGQDLASRDGQYATNDVGSLARRSAIAQPFDNDYRLASLTVRHSLGGINLVSVSSYTIHSIDTRFDATPPVTGASLPDARQAYVEDIEIKLFSHETRLTGSFGTQGSWVSGLSAIDNIEQTTRYLGPSSEPGLLSDVRNGTLDAALFGEATLGLVPDLTVTLGGRLSYVRETGEPAGVQVIENYEPIRSQFRALPTAALSWIPGTDQIVYVRYQEGYRPGALEIVYDAGQPRAARFEHDHVRTFEMGWRFGASEGTGLSGGIVGSVAWWDDIQADLIGEDGLPYIANIGSGRVQNIAARLAYASDNGFVIEASGFFARSNLAHPAAGFDAATDRDLPNIADEGWRLAAKQRWSLAGGSLSLDGALRYVGRSKLAIRPPFDLPQGRYYDASLGLRFQGALLGITLDVSNLLNSRANTFAFGNPFTLASGTQQTPPRPRSLRLGIDANF